MMHEKQVARGATVGLALGISLMTLLSPSAAGASQQREVPEGYQQVLPRGGIPAIDSPVYVPAGEADIRPEAWVLGVVIDGQPRAYSLALLNFHEIVNDTIGDTNFAAVW